jgi:hypothetical protein
MEGCPTFHPEHPISDADCRKTRGWFRHAADTLDLGVDTESWTDFFYQNAEVDPVELAKPPGSGGIPQFEPTNFERLPANLPPEYLDAAHDVLRGMHKLFDLRSTVRGAQGAGHPRWYDSLLRLITPWFLAIALPIRIAKNSAQYLTVREKNISATSSMNADPSAEDSARITEQDGPRDPNSGELT